MLSGGHYVQLSIYASVRHTGETQIHLGTSDSSILHLVFPVYMQQCYLPMRIGNLVEAHRQIKSTSKNQETDARFREIGCMDFPKLRV